MINNFLFGFFDSYFIGKVLQRVRWNRTRVSANYFSLSDILVARRGLTDHFIVTWPYDNAAAGGLTLMKTCVNQVFLMLTSPHPANSGQVVRKASTFCRQPALSTAAVDTPVQLLHPALSLSISAVLHYVPLGLSSLWRPSGSTTLQSYSHCRIVCP